MRVTPRRCVPLANACQTIYTGSKRTSGRNHHVRTPSPVWRKRYINLNLWGPCLKWSLKSRSPQHDSEWQQSQRVCGSLSKYIGLSSYRIYANPSILSSRSPHKRTLLSTPDMLRLDAFYAIPRLLYVIRRLWVQMIHNRNQNTRFRSITDCFYCIVMEETKIFSLT